MDPATAATRTEGRRAGLSIGEVAARSGVPAKTIRYYEEVGLIEPAPRTGSGYRVYGPVDLHVLRFVQRARSLGFSVRDCRQLLTLWRDPHRASAEVKALTLHRIAEIDRKMAELAGMRATLAHLAENCHGDDRPDCPILEEFAERRSER
jgi:MerR family transcriptional regulator, copper efflux regulator